MRCDGDLVQGDDREDPDFEDLKDLVLWTCNSCHFTLTY